MGCGESDEKGVESLPGISIQDGEQMIYAWNEKWLTEKTVSDCETTMPKEIIEKGESV